MACQPAVLWTAEIWIDTRDHWCWFWVGVLRCLLNCTPPACYFQQQNAERHVTLGARASDMCAAFFLQENSCIQGKYSIILAFSSQRTAAGVPGEDEAPILHPVQLWGAAENVRGTTYKRFDLGAIDYRCEHGKLYLFCLHICKVKNMFRVLGGYFNF